MISGEMKYSTFIVETKRGGKGKRKEVEEGKIKVHRRFRQTKERENEQTMMRGCNREVK